MYEIPLTNILHTVRAHKEPSSKSEATYKMDWGNQSKKNEESQGKVGVNGDEREGTKVHYLSLSSVARDRNMFTSSDDCEIKFDEINNVIGISLMNFEIPHTRYAIDDDNNTLYLSEKIDDGVYNYFGLQVGTGGYQITDLAVSLELSQNSVTTFMTNAVLKNTYSFSAAKTFGKIAVISSGDVEYNIHTCNETLQILTFTKTSDTLATVTFLSPFEYILARGALLTLKVYHEVDREVQVVDTPGTRSVTILGDFSSLYTFGNEDDSQFGISTLYPYSSKNSVSEVAGFGSVDLSSDRHTSCQVLGVQSPLTISPSDDGTCKSMILVKYPLFVSPGDYVRMSGVTGIMQDTPLLVRSTHDDTHFDVEANASNLFEGDDIQVSDNGGATYTTCEEILIEGSEDNLISVLVNVAVDNLENIVVGGTVTLTGLTAEEWSSQSISATITRVDNSTTFLATVPYPAGSVFVEGSTFVTPIAKETGNATTYVSPNRFDLSRGRRVILCRASIDGKDLGSIHSSNDRTTYFGRIQLYSGADLVNFLSVHQAIGHHSFKSLVKRLRSIRFRFYNEDGGEYRFVGVDYTVFLKLLTTDSNTGI